MHLCPTCLIARPVPVHLSKMLFGLEDFRSMVSDESSHCMIHDRIDNHRLAGLEDRKLVYMRTWSRPPHKATREIVPDKIMVA